MTLNQLRNDTTTTIASDQTLFLACLYFEVKGLHAPDYSLI